MAHVRCLVAAFSSSSKATIVTFNDLLIIILIIKATIVNNLFIFN